MVSYEGHLIKMFQNFFEQHVMFLNERVHHTHTQDGRSTEQNVLCRHIVTQVTPVPCTQAHRRNYNTTRYETIPF